MTKDKRPKKRLMMVRISFECLIKWLHGDYPLHKVKSNLPKDAEVVRVCDSQYIYQYSNTNLLCVVISSKEFEPLEEGAEIPWYELEFIDIRN